MDDQERGAACGAVKSPLRDRLDCRTRIFGVLPPGPSQAEYHGASKHMLVTSGIIDLSSCFRLRAPLKRQRASPLSAPPCFTSRHPALLEGFHSFQYLPGFLSHIVQCSLVPSVAFIANAYLLCSPSRPYSTNLIMRCLLSHAMAGAARGGIS